MTEDEAKLRLMKLRRRRRWRRRVLIGAAVALAAVAASPFIFTGALLRYVLSRPEYKELGVRFGSATLSPLGSLEVRDVVIEDAGVFAGKPLVAASSVRVEFGWMELMSSRVRKVFVENLRLTLRPGEDTPLTLIQLGSRVGSGAGSEGAGGPFWMDELQATGFLTVEGPYGWQKVAPVGVKAGGSFEALPLRVLMTMSGARSSPTREVGLVVGDPDETSNLPALATRLRIRPGGAAVGGGGGAGETVIGMDSLSVRNVPVELGRGLVGGLAGGEAAMPAELRGDYAGRLGRAMFVGSLTIRPAGARGGGGVFVNGMVDVRDLSAHQVTGASAPVAASAVALEHWSGSTQIDGRLSASPLTDLAFKNTHCAWEGARFGEWRSPRGEADLQVDGTQIVLRDLQADVGDGQLSANGAYDTASGRFSRGRVWLKGLDLRRIESRLPESVRGAMPGMVEGVVGARFFLTDSDAEHYTASVEVSCPEVLSWSQGATSAATGRAPTTGVGGMAGGGGFVPPVAGNVFGVSLANMSASGTMTWSRRLEGLPEVKGGRLTADDLQLTMPLGPDVPTLRGFKIQSDFSLATGGGGVVRLEDFYANLPGDAQFSADGEYTVATGVVERATVGLRGLELSALNPLLAEGWSLTGQADTVVKFSMLPGSASVAASVQLSPQVAMRMPEGSVAVSGAPGLSLMVRGMMDRSSGMVDLESAALHGLGAVNMDGAGVAYLRGLGGPGSGLESVFEQFKGGVSTSLDDVVLSGRLGLGSDRGFVGTVRIAGLDLGTIAEAGAANGGAGGSGGSGTGGGVEGGLTGVAMSNLTIQALVNTPLSAEALMKGKIGEGQVLVEKLRVGSNVIAGFTGKLTAGEGKLFLKEGGFSFAEGSFKGDATVSYLDPKGAARGGGGRLDQMRLQFSGVNQGIITKNLFPESFTAEGNASGTLELSQDAKGVIGGTLMVEAEGPGRLRISRQAASQTLAGAVKQALESSPNAIVPESLDEIILAQFADYPYSSGHAVLKDGPGGMEAQVDYVRMPLKAGDPGYGVKVKVEGQEATANFLFNLGGGSGVTLRFPTLRLMDVVAKVFGVDFSVKQAGVENKGAAGGDEGGK